MSRYVRRNPGPRRLPPLPGWRPEWRVEVEVRRQGGAERERGGTVDRRRRRRWRLWRRKHPAHLEAGPIGGTAHPVLAAEPGEVAQQRPGDRPLRTTASLALRRDRVEGFSGSGMKVVVTRTNTDARSAFAGRG